MSLTEWQLRYGRLRTIAERVQRMRSARAERVWFEATGYRWDACAVHNASIADVGNGWGAGPRGRAIIKAARAAMRIERSMWEPHRILERWDRRVRQIQP